MPSLFSVIGIVDRVDGLEGDKYTLVFISLYVFRERLDSVGQEGKVRGGAAVHLV
jgi:hypothetical protein